ncbi:MAG: hypothetical protein JWO11_3589 [Nocardioides sp.]|nr:hypothetical protein [Nocardioides sp.]
MTAPTLEEVDLARDPGHRPFCWCHNHADADGVFHWTAELPALRFPLDDTAVEARPSEAA